MGVSNKHHAPAALYPKERAPNTHWIGGRVGLTACLDTEARGKIICLTWGTNPSHPVCNHTLYWLSYPGSLYCMIQIWNFKFHEALKANSPSMLKLLGWGQISKPSTNWSYLYLYILLKITLHFHSKEFLQYTVSYLVSMFIKCVDALSAAQFPYSHSLVRTAWNKMLVVWREGNTKNPRSMPWQSACHICMLPATSMENCTSVCYQY
jgi:hypothetical protein